MATGWGAVGGGAWGGGGTTATTYEDEYDTSPPPKQDPPAPAYAVSNQGYGAPPSDPAPDLASNSFRAQGAGGFGSSSGAYGNAAGGAAGSSTATAQSQSFNATAGVPDIAALKKKEAELAAKEKQLKQLEKALVDSGALKKKNWPRCYPMLHHDIPGEIPEGSRRVVREGYFAWYGLVICLMWNFFCASVILGTDSSQKVPSWFLALIYMLLGIPLGFWLWYLRLYRGAKADSTLGFLGFFIWFGVHTAFCIWAAIAVPFSANKWSFAGFVTAMKALDVSNFAGIIYLVGAGCWTCEALLSLWIIKDVFLFFRGHGGIKQAKQEAAVAALKHQITQQASARV